MSYTKRPENAGAVVMNFVGADRERFDERDGNILVVYGQQLAELFGYLEITADDYEAASKIYADSLERFHALVNATQERLGNDRPMTAEEQELSDEVGLDGLRVYLRIETFYLFAKILLDKLARLVPHYFGHGHGVRLSRHSQLKAALPVFAEQKGLTLPSSLVDRVDELTRRVSDYRDKMITHGHSPRTSRGTAISIPTGEAMILSYRLYPEDESELRTQSESPRTLLPLIEDYVIELVAFISNNRDKADLVKGG